MAKKKKLKLPKFKLLYIFLVLFFIIFLLGVVSYKLMKNKEQSIQKNKIEIKKQKNEDLKEFSKESIDQYLQKELTTIKKKQKDSIEETKEIHKKIKESKKPISPKDIKNTNTKTSQEKSKKTLNYYTYKYNKKDKPKLVILIDDVVSKKQKNNILSTNLKLAMAFLPPTKGHRNSAKIALDIPYAMIHLPMQASSSFKGFEDKTLNITNSYETIEKRVKQLRKWYPHVKYTNNHTGSVFTQSHIGMDRLYKALKKYNFIFVDSRTSAKSVVEKYAKKYRMPFIVRDIFLDNQRNLPYIQNQLKKAIKKAKTKGYAIAIGHPYAVTIKTLKQSKHLLKEVDLIYMHELPYL